MVGWLVGGIVWLVGWLGAWLPCKPGITFIANVHRRAPEPMSSNNYPQSDQTDEGFNTPCQHADNRIPQHMTLRPAIDKGHSQVIRNTFY